MNNLILGYTYNSITNTIVVRVDTIDTLGFMAADTVGGHLSI